MVAYAATGPGASGEVYVGAIWQDITIEQGATYDDLVIECVEADGTTPRDLTGWTGTMQIRASVDSDDVLLSADVVIEVGDDLTTVTAEISDDDTADITWWTGVYDLEITDGIRTERLAQGNVTVSRQVTR